MHSFSHRCFIIGSLAAYTLSVQRLLALRSILHTSLALYFSWADFFWFGQLEALNGSRKWEGRDKPGHSSPSHCSSSGLSCIHRSSAPTKDAHSDSSIFPVSQTLSSSNTTSHFVLQVQGVVTFCLTILWINSLSPTSPSLDLYKKIPYNKFPPL